MSLTLSPQVFSILSALVEEELGLHYGADDAPIFADKIAARARDAGFHSALDYYYYLRYDEGAPAEMEALADALVVGETYFFRELEPLRSAVAHALLPAIAKRGTARVWSAACATGEEPLSLAMVLDEAGIQGQCEIVATDLSALALSKARKGRYGPRSMRVFSPRSTTVTLSKTLATIAETALVPVPQESTSTARGGDVQASPSLLEKVSYQQMNLLDADAIAKLGSFDLILCRNVLIYFADATVKRVVTALAGALEPSGRLLIGASESLLRFGTVLRCEERGGTFFYTKERA